MKNYLYLTLFITSLSIFLLSSCASDKGEGQTTAQTNNTTAQQQANQRNNTAAATQNSNVNKTNRLDNPVEARNQKVKERMKELEAQSKNDDRSKIRTEAQRNQKDRINIDKNQADKIGTRLGERFCDCIKKDDPKKCNEQMNRSLEAFQKRFDDQIFAIYKEAFAKQKGLCK